MTQVHVLTINPKQVISLENRRAELVGIPPNNSPYWLSKDQLKIVEYVKGSCFHSVVDRITGTRYKTREWQNNWFQHTMDSLNSEVAKELDPYKGRIIHLDGVTDLFGYVTDKYDYPYRSNPVGKSTTVNRIRSYRKFLTIEVRKGKPIMYETRDGWRFDPNESEKIELVAVRTVTEMITAIASHSTQVEKVTT